MKFIQSIISMAAAALLVTACNKNENLAPQADNFPADGVIRVATQVNQPQTRAGMTSDNLTDFFMHVENPVEMTGKYTYFVKMKKEANASWMSYNPQDDSAISQGLPVSEKVMLWQNKVNSVNVTAFRIPNNVVDSNWASEHRIGVETDQTVKANMEKSDILLMIKKSVNPSTDLTVDGKMRIQLDHFLTKLNLTFKLGTEFNLLPGGTASNIIEEVRIGGSSTGVMWKLGEPSLTINFSKPEDILPLSTSYTAGEADSKMAEAKYECILIPQTVPNMYANTGDPMTPPSNLIIKIKIGGKTYAWEHKSNILFANNSQYNLTLNVGKDAVTLSGFTVQPWGDGGSHDVETE
ncbi:Fimbrillin-like protein [anaerobic digester metagenome]|uniref:fimbrillin family protein n=1 Tax=Petrimonas sp. TaxID=2023866 RepID=UPI0030CBA426